MCAILDRRDPANRRAVAQGEKELAVCGGVKGIPPVQGIAHRDAKWWNPLRVFAMVIDLPWKVYKAPQVARGLD